MTITLNVGLFLSSQMKEPIRIAGGSLCSMPSPRHIQVALKVKVKQKIRTVFSPFHKKRSGISSPPESLSPQSQFSPQELGSLPVELPTDREMHELYGG